MLTTVLIVIVLSLLLLAAFRLHRMAVRLDRLHVRTEAAWAALVGALSRRIVVVRAITALSVLAASTAATLRELAATADNAAPPVRAGAEDTLSLALTAVDTELPAQLLAELADARLRVELATAFYNDAVRDTVALRSSAFVRFFRLAGRASLPRPFTLIHRV